MEFKRARTGLYYYNINSFRHHEHRLNDKEFTYLTTDQRLSTSMIQTVNDNKSLMSKREVDRADTALKYQELLMWPSTADYKRLVSNNLVTNAPINVDDIEV